MMVDFKRGKSRQQKKRSMKNHNYANATIQQNLERIALIFFRCDWFFYADKKKKWKQWIKQYSKTKSNNNSNTQTNKQNENNVNVNIVTQKPGLWISRHRTHK